MKINVSNGNLSEKEIEYYVKYIQQKYPHETLSEVNLVVDGDSVTMSYSFVPYKMERIRRITGYLVGTMDRWNDAKQAEEHDRVKHM